MAGQPQQQPAGQPVATDPAKAQENQIYKGGDEGHDAFDKAREGMNQKLREKQQADADAAAAEAAKQTAQAKAEGEATALVNGIDIDQIANEVDADWQMAERIRALRTMSPENEAKLKTLIDGVKARHQSRIDELLNDPQYQDKKPEGTVAGQQPQQQPPAQPGQQPAQQNPNEQVPPAQPGQQPAVKPPEQQLDNNQLLESKLNEIRTEMNDKFKKQENELEQERIRREEAERKMKEMEEAENRRVQEQVRSQFDENAGKMGVPDDLKDVAFGKARDIVNANQRQMSWDEIFTRMKEEFPSLFRGGGGAPAATEGGEQAGAEGAPGQKKVAVKPGTGSNAGGAAPGKQPDSKPQKKEHESFDEAKKALSERAAKLSQGAG